MGLSVLDAGVVIGFLDGNDAHHLAASTALGEARDRNDRLVLPASALAETLVGPSRRGAKAIAAVRSLIGGFPSRSSPSMPPSRRRPQACGRGIAHSSSPTRWSSRPPRTSTRII